MRKLTVAVVVLVAVVVSAASSSASTGCRYRAFGALPDRACTPGALNPAVTQAIIGSTICTTGWTSTVRPALAVTEPQKVAAVAAYGARFGSNLRAYEYDHLVPLELGGATDDPRNLWPEPAAVIHGFGSFDKDVVENELRARVCSGAMTLAAAQHIFETDWRKGLRLVVASTPGG